MKLASVVPVVILFLASSAQAADTRTLVALARQHVETEDSRGSGRLVRVDASGNRTSNAVAIKAHWFPGVLRVLLEITPSKTPAGSAPQDGRISILFETRPNGQNTIQVFHPHESSPVVLSFSKWNESVVGTDFDYEDFLQAEYYWRDQIFFKTAKLGARDCDVLKSTAGAADRSHDAEVQTWFDQASGYPVFVQKTAKVSANVKTFTSFGLTQSGGAWTARQVEVKTEGRPGSTLLMFERGSTKAHLTAKDFSPEQISQFEDHP